MKISVVQTDIAWEERDSNLRRMGKLLKKVPHDSNIIILPETFSTGFTMNTGTMAEDNPSITESWMVSISENSGKAICGSYIARENGMCFNRFIFASPGKAPFKYDKRHLFSIAGENEKYTRGSARTLINYGGMKILPSICYDLRFPVWLRNRNDYDLMICVANWPESRREVWNTLLKARAIENQCYVAGVNRIGCDKNGNSYSGDSCVIDPKGNIIAAVPEYQEGIASAEISLDFLSEFRDKFPVWKDADRFDLEL